MRHNCERCGKPLTTGRKNGTRCPDCIQARYDGRDRNRPRCSSCDAEMPLKRGRPAKLCEKCKAKPTEPCSLCGEQCVSAHGGRVYTYCDKCVKDRRRDVRKDTGLRKAYGISLTQYEEILKRQGGKCGSCRKVMRQVCVDHNHHTGVVRGLLCQPCNTGIGLLGDNVEGLMRALAYLKGVDTHTRG